MKSYWDSSALVEAFMRPEMLARLEKEKAITRPHALAEVFSCLTGNPVRRINADNAAAVIHYLSRWLQFVELTPAEILAALKNARAKGVRGGRVHDFLHAVAAEKAGAKKILTLDRNDFTDLTPLPIEQA